MAEMVTEPPVGVTAEQTPGRRELVNFGSFDDYAAAQRTVDTLSDRKFPVEFVSIIGTDLRMVEQVTGRLTWGLAALRGLAAGAWAGLFAGLVAWFLMPPGRVGGTVLWLLIAGALFGVLASLVAYAATGGRRDFISRSAIVPGRFDVMVEAEAAEQARLVLSEAPVS